ncbi:hypothetical protein BHE74_00018031 [Ensete ventricosum]|nr:hypothetical protein GW17_00005394 [Ensete ventricosum]RWW74056.1 hypothetical protein BHE74_00018031 [Ensete ventricosum]RZR86828.1 hypothetical protein BHM03_00014107 [Ensete ventricosum]
MLIHQTRKKKKKKEGQCYLLFPLSVAGVPVEIEVDEEVPRLPHDVGGSPRLRLEEALHLSPRRPRTPPDEAGPQDCEAPPREGPAATVMVRARWGSTGDLSPQASTACSIGCGFSSLANNNNEERRPSKTTTPE